MSQNKKISLYIIGLLLMAAIWLWPETGWPHSTGLIIPTTVTQQIAPVRLKGVVTLPQKFDNRSLIPFTPLVHDQDAPNSCGSCYVFAPKGLFEDAIGIQDKRQVDLSAQALMDGDRLDHGCDGGWYGNVLDMFSWQYSRCLDPANVGATLSALIPYSGVYGSTHCPYIPYYKATNDFVLPNAPGQNVADVNAVEEAIFQYGGVVCGVVADLSVQGWSAKAAIYNQGTFTPGQINHAIELIGWDNTTTPPMMTFKNSWGTSWGNDGYGRIVYGVNLCGYMPMYLTYAGTGPIRPTPTPTPVVTPIPTPAPILPSPLVVPPAPGPETTYSVQTFEIGPALAHEGEKLVALAAMIGLVCFICLICAILTDRGGRR